MCLHVCVGACVSCVCMRMRMLCVNVCAFVCMCMHVCAFLCMCECMRSRTDQRATSPLYCFHILTICFRKKNCSYLTSGHYLLFAVFIQFHHRNLMALLLIVPVVVDQRVLRLHQPYGPLGVLVHHIVDDRSLPKTLKSQCPSKCTSALVRALVP